MGFLQGIRNLFSGGARGYDAGLRGRPNKHWHAVNQSAQQEDLYDRDTLRARARDLERNSDIANSVLLAFRRNVVGRGYRLKPETGDTDLNERITLLWEEWCKARNCDVTGRQSLTEQLRMWAQRKKVDGGILIVKRYTRAGVIPFQIQTLEVDELDNAALTPHYKGNQVVGGVEYNRWNQPVGYHIRQYEVGGTQIGKSVWVDAKDVIFWYSKHRPSQIREISDLAPLITRVRDTNELITAAETKSRAAACLSVLIKRSVLSTVGRNAQAPERESYEGKTLAPGMLLELNPGDDVQVVSPNGASDEAVSMIKTLVRTIASGAGLSYEAVSRDMSETNYSSARQGMIEDNETFAEEIEQVHTVLDEVYETFLISAVLSGVLHIPAFWDERQKYMRHSWAHAPKPWIDPLKEANATKIAIQSGQKSFQDTAAESGRDWRRMIDDMAEVTEYACEKGLTIGGVIYGQEIESASSEDQAGGAV